MENMIAIAVPEAAACPSSVRGYRSVSARVTTLSWRSRMSATGRTVVGAGAGSSRTTVAPKPANDLRHTFVDLHQGSRSRTRCRLS